MIAQVHCGLESGTSEGRSSETESVFVLRSLHWRCWLVLRHQPSSETGAVCAGKVGGEAGAQRHPSWLYLSYFLPVSWRTNVSLSNFRGVLSIDKSNLKKKREFCCWIKIRKKRMSCKLFWFRFSVFIYKHSWPSPSGRHWFLGCADTEIWWSPWVLGTKRIKVGIIDHIRKGFIGKIMSTKS